MKCQNHKPIKMQKPKQQVRVVRQEVPLKDGGRLDAANAKEEPLKSNGVIIKRD